MGPTGDWADSSRAHRLSFSSKRGPFSISAPLASQRLPPSILSLPPQPYHSSSVYHSVSPILQIIYFWHTKSSCLLNLQSQEITDISTDPLNQFVDVLTELRRIFNIIPMLVSYVLTRPATQSRSPYEDTCALAIRLGILGVGLVGCA